MRALKSLVLASVALMSISVSGIAVADETVAAPTSSRPPSMQLRQNYDRDRLTWSRVQNDRAKAAPTDARWARAEQAAQLINRGRCAEARDQAVAQQDDLLATRISEVCASRL